MNTLVEIYDDDCRAYSAFKKRYPLAVTIGENFAIGCLVGLVTAAAGRLLSTGSGGSSVNGGVSANVVGPAQRPNRSGRRFSGNLTDMGFNNQACSMAA